MPGSIRVTRQLLSTHLPFFIGLLALTWSYFSAPGKILYIRYFEAYSFFNPGFVFTNDVGGWSSLLHLGYPTLTESSYISLLFFWLWALVKIFGVALASAIYPASIIAVMYAGFFWFSRSLFPKSPPLFLSIAGVFFCGNAYATGFIHEGYSSMLVQWALIPICLKIIDVAAARDARLIAIIPLLFIGAAMFQYPEVAIDLMFLLALRWRTIGAILQQNGFVMAALLLFFAVNVYWMLPLLANLHSHASFPILSESSGDISAATRYASLSNTFLLRSYTSFWTYAYGARECSFCDYLVAPYYPLAMVAILIASLYGLWAKQLRLLFVICLVAFILATGYRYQDDLIGIPYQILMGLPIYGLFRGAGMFLSASIFAISIGLVAFLEYMRDKVRAQSKWLLLSAIACIAVVVACLPMISGRWLERGTSASPGIVSFPNFPVTLPRAYKAAPAALNRMLGTSDAVTLILPNMPFANYRWGVYGNDFLPALLGRPTLSKMYWPQPNPQVDYLLNELSVNKDRAFRETALAAMRIGAVLIHDDTDSGRAITRNWGRLVWENGHLSIVRPPLKTIPILEAGPVAVRVLGAPSSSTAVRVTSGAIARPFAASPAGCSSSFDEAWADVYAPIVPGKPITVGFPLRCQFRGILQVTVLGRGGIRVFRQVDSSVAVPLSGRLHRDGIWTRFTFDAGNIKGARYVIQSTGAAADVASVRVRGTGTPLAKAKAIAFHPWMGLYQEIKLPIGDKVMSLNESYDPEWLAFSACNGLKLVPHFLANGYANGFYSGDCRRIVLVSGAGVVQALGFALAAVALLLGAGALVLAKRQVKRAG